MLGVTRPRFEPAQARRQRAADLHLLTESGHVRGRCSSPLGIRTCAEAGAISSVEVSDGAYGMGVASVDAVAAPRASRRRRRPCRSTSPMDRRVHPLGSLRRRSAPGGRISSRETTASRSGSSLYSITPAPPIAAAAAALAVPAQFHLE